MYQASSATGAVIPAAARIACAAATFGAPYAVWKAGLAPKSAAGSSEYSGVTVSAYTVLASAARSTTCAIAWRTATLLTGALLTSKTR